MKFSIIGFIPTLLLLIPVIAACFKTPPTSLSLRTRTLSFSLLSVWADLAA